MTGRASKVPPGEEMQTTSAVERVERVALSDVRPPAKKPAPELRRAIPCLGCAKSALSGKGDGECFDFVPVKKTVHKEKCERCAKSNHKCEPCPAEESMFRTALRAVFVMLEEEEGVFEDAAAAVSTGEDLVLARKARVLRHLEAVVDELVQ
ncbi:hypothetical protein A9K55_003652 [Cordyceps militaris]|uniref:Uncharacterized protein n=1 Tax=Cordyceps militaris TaxID=73501 RepID=A0A2H4S9E8_CORMI|nr:hypothetical protein A9K55_003652 [Cordyceps militaris]